MSAFLFAFVCVFPGSAPEAKGEFTHEVQPGFTGAPVVWAKPLADGPIRALFIAPRFTLGDVVQLSARLDMHYETVALWDAHSIGYDPMAFAPLPEGGSHEEALDRIRAALKKRLDVIVLGNFDTDILPEDVFSTILDKVAAGTGLLIAHARNSADSPLYLVFEALSPVEDAFPPWHGVGECAFPGSGALSGLVHTRAHENGRIVMLQYPGDPPRNHCLIQSPADPLDMDSLYEENAYSFLARTLCVATGRLTGTRIAALHDVAPLGPQEDEIPPDFYPEFVQAMRDSVVAQPARPFQIIFNEPAEQRYSISAQLRRTNSDVLITWNDPDLTPRGATSHQFEIPVGAGAYTLDVWLRTRSGIVDWHSADFILPGWPEFHNLKLEKTWLLPNDSLEVSVEVRPVVNHTRQATVYARAVDPYGRVVSEVSAGVSHQGGPVRLRLHFSDLLAALVKLEVYALEGAPRGFSEWELHSAYRETRYVSVRQRPGPDMMDVVVSAAEPREYASLFYFRRLANQGVNWLHAPAGEATIVLTAQCRLALVPQVDNVGSKTVRDGLYREPCLNNPGFRDEKKDSLRDTTLRHWAGGFGRYSLGNNNSLSESSHHVCQCRHCMTLFQEMLLREYPNLTVLNAAWQNAFQDWDFVELPSGFGPGETGTPAPWVDFRRYMDMAFAGYHGWARQMTQNTDNNAVVGARFASDMQSVRGCHWPALFDTLDFVAVDYSELMAHKIRSYSPPGAWSGASLHNKSMLKTADMHAWLPWRLALDGIRALWLDNPFGEEQHPSPDAWLLPDGRATAELEMLLNAVGRIRDTVGPLLYAATPDTPDIAIYDSHASRLMAEVDATYDIPTNTAQQAAADMMRLAGFSFIFIDKAGLLNASPEKYKAIILPLCRALDSAEAAALQRYVTAGGALIADVLPGDCDSHGVWRREYNLASLFGIDITDAPDIVANTLITEGDTAADAVHAGTVLANSAVVPTSGRALARAGETPAWIVNRHDKGRTFLLNHPFRAVVHEKGRRLVPHEFNSITAFIGELPDMGKHREPETFLGTVNYYRFGDARIYVALPDYDAPRQRVHFPLQRNDTAYNALTGEQIRRPHRARLQTAAGQPLVITVLPNPITKLFVDVPETIHAGQRLSVRIMAQTDAGRSGKHLFIVDLMPWNGAPIAWYRRIVTAEAGLCEVTIPLAHNEILGRYSLRVRDAATGIQTTVPVSLSSPVN